MACWDESGSENQSRDTVGWRSDRTYSVITSTARIILADDGSRRSGQGPNLSVISPCSSLGRQKSGWMVAPLPVSALGFCR